MKWLQSGLLLAVDVPVVIQGAQWHIYAELKGQRQNLIQFVPRNMLTPLKHVENMKSVLVRSSWGCH